MTVKYKIPLKIVYLDEKSFHLIAEARINGNKVNVLIDTGASRTVFDRSLLSNELQAGNSGEAGEIFSAGIMAGSIESQFATAESFTIGKLELKNFHVVLIDLNGINKLYKKVTGKQVHGLLGSDFLLEMNAKLDYENAVLVLKNPSSAGG